MRTLPYPVFAAALLGCAAPSFAHELIPGVTGFPGEMLHPLLVAEFAASYIACALLAGSAARERFLMIVTAFVAGMIAGKSLFLLMPAVGKLWFAPMVCTLLAGLAVAALRPVSFLLALGLVFALAFFVSAGIVQEQPGMAGLARSVAAFTLTGTLVLVVLGYPLTLVKSRWGGILVRVAGAWMAAISMMYLAFAWQVISGGAALPN